MEFIFSLFEVAAKTFVKALVTALVKRTVSRAKEKTAPIASRDGSRDAE